MKNYKLQMDSFINSSDSTLFLYKFLDAVSSFNKLDNVVLALEQYLLEHPELRNK